MKKTNFNNIINLLEKLLAEAHDKLLKQWVDYLDNEVKDFLKNRKKEQTPQDFFQGKAKKIHRVSMLVELVSEGNFDFEPKVFKKKSKYQDELKKQTEINLNDMEKRYMEKILFKISPILSKHKTYSSQIIDMHIKQGVMDILIKITVDKNYFCVKNQLVWVHKDNGVLFSKYPTTFRDVFLNGKKYKKVSQEWLVDNF